ncbi:dephospho-CoA kinase [Arthrobacter echini]|uniref:Dephospho-CoA kinase n=1 Tax=Arthrobacter echini TaxID=1529066 RepID=A0A5D0XQ16_9MICC|nr:dephospho-CoA kinase [Arthrobacter echini]TYC98704.1 dephospho-CoA kinase [Arthrobacter echini]
MLRIGLTGGIAAGKSVVARHFRDLGAVLVDADVLARAALEPGSEGLHEVVAAFGASVLGADGGLDRAMLGRLVFADDRAREQLNGIVHPRVRSAAAQLIAAAPQDAIVVEDIPLLVETGQAPRFHLVVVVDAPDEERVARMVEQRSMGRSDALQRIAAQASREERLREADAVLVNDAALDDLLAATRALWHGRVVPFRDNLAAPRPAVLPPSTTEGLAGTSALGRRIVAKLEASLPEGTALPAVLDEAVRTASDDVAATSIRLPLRRASKSAQVSLALAAAGFPRAADRDHPGAGPEAVHRSADPALDVAILVAAPHAGGA